MGAVGSWVASSFFLNNNATRFSHERDWKIYKRLEAVYVRGKGVAALHRR